MKRLLGLIALLVMAGVSHAQGVVEQPANTVMGCGNAACAPKGMTTLPILIPSNTVLGSVAGGAPGALTNPQISGLNFATQTLKLGATSGAPLPFGTTNSLLYTHGDVGGINLQGYATNPGNDVYISPFELYFAADSASTQYTSGNNGSMVWLAVNGNITTGHYGGRSAMQGRLNITGVPTGTNGAAYTSINGIARVGANLTGTTGAYGNYAGAVNGGNFNVFTSSGATFIQNLNTQENDVALTLGASAAEKHLLTLVQTSTDSVNAVYDDSAVSFSTQDRWNATCTTSPLSLGATGCTIVTGSGMVAGDYMIVFRNTAQDIRYMTCTGADPALACTWSPSLTSATTLINGYDLGNIAPWKYGINFGAYAHLMPFFMSLTAPDSGVFAGSTLIGYTNRQSGGAKTATANIGIDFSNVTFSGNSINVPGFTVGPVGQITENTGTTISEANQGLIGMGHAILTSTFNDTTTGSGTVTNDYAFSIGAPVFTNTQGTANTLANAVTAYFATPVCGSGWTACTNLYSILAAGAIKAGAGLTATGGINNLNVNQNFVTNLNTGTSSGTVNIGSGSGNNAINIGNGTGKVTVTGVLIYGGTTLTVTGGTGACASSSTLTGSPIAGKFTATGTTGACAFKIPMTANAPNDITCYAYDFTHYLVATVTTQSISGCTFNLTSVTANDVIYVSQSPF